jgi:hypothetical protein
MFNEEQETLLMLSVNALLYQAVQNFPIIAIDFQL